MSSTARSITSLIRRRRLRVGVRKIAEQREPEILVVIGERAHFERVDELLHAAGRRQDRRHGDDRSQVVGDAVAQRELRQRPRWNQRGEDRVQEAQRQLGHRKDGDERDQRDHPWRRAVVSRVEQQARFEQRRREQQRSEISDRRVLEDEARDALTRRRRVADGPLELEPAARDQVVADVMRAIGVRALTPRLLGGRQWRAPRLRARPYPIAATAARPISGSDRASADPCRRTRRPDRAGGSAPRG